MFFVIDWIDWSWKWTQLELVKAELEKMWKTVAIFDYPRYGLNLSHYVERYLNGEYGDLSAKMWSLFYAIDRFDESFEIRKALEEKDFVIANRYVSANIIHQAAKIEDQNEYFDFVDWNLDLEYNICKIPKPDKTIFLSVNPDMSKKLIQQKEERKYIKWGGNVDLHEADDEHMIWAFKKAHLAAERLWWTTIECLDSSWEMRSRESIRDEILKNVIS